MGYRTVDFTREPIIETIITPKEGYKLVIRSSTSAGQEEYFVDAVEVVAFGHAFFFRSLERPKAFLVPVSDYEVLEVREARMVLKNAGLDRSIKIGGGREGSSKASREVEKGEMVVAEEREREQEEPTQEIEAPAAEVHSEVRVDKKRDRRRHYRKRKGRDDQEEGKEESAEPSVPPLEDEKINIQPPEPSTERNQEGAPLSPVSFSSLLQPPPTLISETINRYRQNDLFKGAFYLTEEEQYKPHDKVQDLLNEDDEEERPPILQEPDFAQEEKPVDSDSSLSSTEEVEETEISDQEQEFPLEMPAEENEETAPDSPQEEETTAPESADASEKEMIKENESIPPHEHTT